MYKVFIIGNSNSIWTREYVRNIHADGKNQIFITAYDPLTEEAASDYKEMGVTVVNLFSKNRVLNKVSKTFKLAKFCLIDCKKYGIDYVDIQSPPHSIQATFLYYFLKNVKADIIIEFWGSDIMRVSSEGAKRMHPLFSIASYVNVSTKEIRDSFKAHYGDEFDSRFVAAKFGSLAFGEIKKLKEKDDKKLCKARFGLDENKLTVAIGHNGNMEQQHVAVLNELKTLREDLKEKIELMIHLGYGVPGGYADEVKKAAEECGISFIILEELYDLKNIAKLRVATDIIVHAQTTDALSGSIRECLYAGGVLLNPSWISYEEFDRLGIEYVKYDDFDEIASYIEKLIIGDIGMDIGHNIEALGEAFSWDAVKKDWMMIFNERTS